MSNCKKVSLPQHIPHPRIFCKECKQQILAIPSPEKTDALVVLAPSMMYIP